MTEQVELRRALCVLAEQEACLLCGAERNRHGVSVVCQACRDLLRPALPVRCVLVELYSQGELLTGVAVQLMCAGLDALSGR